jgi:hypothetical protein
MNAARRISIEEARAHLARLELSQQGLARLIGRNPATIRKWLNPEHPDELPIEIGIMLELLTPARLRKLQREADELAGAGDR